MVRKQVIQKHGIKATRKRADNENLSRHRRDMEECEIELFQRRDFDWTSDERERERLRRDLFSLLVLLNGVHGTFNLRNWCMCFQLFSIRVPRYPHSVALVSRHSFSEWVRVRIVQPLSLTLESIVAWQIQHRRVWCLSMLQFSFSSEANRGANDMVVSVFVTFIFSLVVF